MTAGDSPLSYPSDIEDYIDYYTRPDYWSDYDFKQLIDDTECTTYPNEQVAQEIRDAFLNRAEEENIELSPISTFRHRFTFNYKLEEDNQWVHATIRFRDSQWVHATICDF